MGRLVRGGGREVGGLCICFKMRRFNRSFDYLASC